MFETFQNQICIQGGWLYSKKGGNIMPKYTYDNLVRRGPFNVVRKGGGRNTPALITWASVPEDYKQQIIQLVGDPTRTKNNIIFTDHLERDTNAVKFYANHTLETGDGIAEDIQKKHCAEAAIFNAINSLLHNRILKTKALGTGGLTATWKKLATIVHELPRHQWPHALPSNYRSLQRKYRAYMADGYEALIHGGHGHKNSEKINDHAKLFVLARWGDRVQKVANLEQLLEEYNTKAVEEGWKTLKDHKTLYKYLYQPEVKSMWYAYRHGELKAKEKYAFQNSTKMPTMRDSLWYSDGTKLNFYYRDQDNKMATCQVYEVMDAYSEVFLGYHISKTEDYEAQYFAFKMAVKNSGHRPYEVRFDNQGGHKKLTKGNFMPKLAHLAIKTQPYNGKSKTIESAFGRFQQQILKKHWYFTGQNITAKKEESKANMEFILANVANLPTLEEAKAAYAADRLEWNQRRHFDTNRPRLDMYLSSKNPKAPSIDLLEMVDIFWIERDKPVKLTAYGLTFVEKRQKHTYMVYNHDRMPDFEFLQNNIDRKFHIKFDPEDMSLIYLFEMTPLGLRRVTAAETKVETARNVQEQADWESEYYRKISDKAKASRVERRNEMDDILEKFNMTPESYGLNSPKLKGIETSKANKTPKSTPKLDKKRREKDIAEHQKELSNVDPYTTDDNGDIDIHKLM